MTKYLALFSFLLTTTALLAQSGTVVFQIEGIQTQKGGEISAGIFIKENFPEVGQQLKGIAKAVKGQAMEMTINDVPVGKYGAVAFQDIDKDKDLKTNLVGFPKEPIGFANDAKIRFGPPAFEDAMIEVRANQTTYVKIKLK